MSYVIRAPGTVHAATLRRSDPPGRDFFGTAYGQSGDRFDGLQPWVLGSVIFDDTLLLIEPEAAAVYEAANRPAEPTGRADMGQPSTTSPGGSQPVPGAAKTTVLLPGKAEIVPCDSRSARRNSQDAACTDRR